MMCTFFYQETIIAMTMISVKKCPVAYIGLNIKLRVCGTTCSVVHLVYRKMSEKGF